MNDTPTRQRLGRVIQSYQAQYTDPISVQAREPLQVSAKTDPWNNNPAWLWVWCTDPRGKSGWVPQNLIDPNNHTARCDYSAIELSAHIGETLTIESTNNGWHWCTNQQGQRGWIPIDHLTEAL
jgi:uncharacterized protein YgiM (DUF1202 family)